MSTQTREVDGGQRFAFGKNWQRFLATLDESKIAAAEESLIAMLGDIRGRSFLDIGCGSGLSSLAAHRLGAIVRSFDFDPQSVACTRELERRYGTNWQCEEGSVLDKNYILSLGKYDIVYSWGVLHHTGDMWRSFENVAQLVKPGGLLFISIYNDQGGQSRRWRNIKRTYNLLPSILRLPFMLTIMAPRELLYFLAAVLRLEPMRYFRTLVRSNQRGMNWWHDMIDWIGGYPFEVAKPELVFSFFHERGFHLLRMTTCAGSIGCNEFVFTAQR